ncbi:heme-thiolate peroxidase [Pleurotus djamor]|nr:heme-thiolate peroxidase [Pleurotus djamor]
MSGVVSKFTTAWILGWDVVLTLCNVVLPQRKIGHVTPKGKPGEGGKWPEFVPPKEGDSRCACPALNAMANHGILPHDGRNITFKEMTRTIRETYNFAPSFCYFVPNYAANMLGKNYDTDTFDLEEISLHNGIEHDGSMTRQDLYHQKDQGKPYLPYIEELLASASGKDKAGNPLLTIEDVAHYMAKRRVDAPRENPEFTTTKFHENFGSSNSSTLLTIYGGRMDDLRPILVEERIPDGWESRIRKPFGLTMITFNVGTVFKVEKESQKEQKVYAASLDDSSVHKNPEPTQ